MNRLVTGTIVALVLVGILLVFFNLSPVYIVNQYEQALVVRLGDPRRVTDEAGIHFKIPGVEHVEKIDKRVLSYEGTQEEVLTEDKKRVVVDYFARYRVVDPLRFFQAVRNEESLGVRLGPIVRSQLRRVLGGKPMSRILTNERAAMMLEITKAVDTEAKGFGVTVLDVRMKHVDLPSDNSKAVFGQMQKQREQEAKGIRAEGDRDKQEIQAEADKQRTILLAEAQRKSEILRGEGDAKATQIYSDAFGRDPQFYNFYRSMLALQKGLPGSNTTYVGPAVGDFFRFFGDEQGAEDANTGDPLATGQ